MTAVSEKPPIPVITIDGPSGTGKGTLCHKIAQYLNWHVLDSGCIYRVLAYAAIQYKLKLTDAARLIKLLHKLNLSFHMDHDQNLVLLNGKNIFTAIRTEDCGQAASKIAILPTVREALLEQQRAFAKPPGLVTDGRDMGTVVFPDAFLKIYLIATASERANRRYLQLKEKGIDVSLSVVMDEMLKRDSRDLDRLAAPLQPAKDALIVDTSGLTIAKVLDIVLKLVEDRLYPGER